MKKAFTLVEMIVTIVVLSILSTGIFIAIKNLYVRASKSETISNFSVDSEVALNAVSSLLYERVPSTLIGYDAKNNIFESIYQISNKYNILEWIGVANESFDRRYYSGFVDLDGSDKDTYTLLSFGIDEAGLDDMLEKKFQSGRSWANGDLALIFAGSFDNGDLVLSSDFNTSFGWHGNSSELIYTISNIQEDNITLAKKPDEIFEKYYLVDSAYAIARAEDVNISSCDGVDTDMIDKDTLLLFYDFRPWKGETFCADLNGDKKEGNVTVLLQHVVGFEAGLIDENIYFNLTLSTKIRGSENNITISKQKVVF
jgi:prepilin-type N-terminal cleavage/methylation domain-containing protein